MNTNTFRKRIQNTALLSEERKAHFLSRAEFYSPEIRANMIKTLLQHEKDFIEKEVIVIQQKRSDELHKQKEEQEAFHEAEIQKAEAELLKDLETLEQEEKIEKETKSIQEIEKQEPKKSGSPFLWIIFITILVFLVWKFELYSKILPSQSTERNEQTGHQDSSKKITKSKPKIKRIIPAVD